VPTTVARHATKTQTASEHRVFLGDDDSVPEQHGNVRAQSTARPSVGDSVEQQRGQGSTSNRRRRVQTPRQTESDRGPASARSWLDKEAPSSSEVDSRLGVISTELIPNFLQLFSNSSAWQTYAR